MRRISIAFVLSTLLLVSICSAQQTSSSDNKQTNSGQSASNVGIEGPVIGGDGTRNFIPIWATPGYLLSSVIYQASGGKIGIGTTTPATTLDVNGGINAATTYGIGGSTVLNIGSGADGNLFLGVGAGASNIAGSGHSNLFSGFKAGFSNTTGYGNTFSGYGAGFSNTTACCNTFVGLSAGTYNTGDSNTFIGRVAGFNNTTGFSNTFSGDGAGYYNTTGSWNAFYGVAAGQGNTTGSHNIFFGFVAGAGNTSGSSDIYIGNGGSASGTESNTIRIGTQGTGDGQQNVAYIAGIYGSTVGGSGVAVYVDNNGQLGTSASSLRFKQQVRDMGDSTSALMKLRPVTFLYKPEYDKGERTLQYGLIAEEVARVYPDLVAYDNDGQPYSVRYQYITTMLLNEVQKQYHRAEAEAKVIATQEQKIDDLEERLSRLESLIPQTVAQK